MKLFRNPEIKREILYYIIVYLAGAALAFRQLGGKGAGIVLLAGAAALVLHLCFTAKRYRRIAQMSEKMDSILHDDGETLLQDCQEGEVAVLHTQLSKLVLRMREQAGNLQQDKIFLADALADISHQLKTPLTSLQLLASFLQEAGRRNIRHEGGDGFGRRAYGAGVSACCGVHGSAGYPLGLSGGAGGVLYGRYVLERGSGR